jgi:hypothetical protein
MSVDLATISRADVARVSAFLHEHLDAEVSAERWARAIDVPWSTELGYMLLDGEAVVGAQLAWSSERTVGGRPERFCNLGSWCVLPEYRRHSLRLLRAALADRDCTYTDLTPRPEVVRINERLGFEHLDTTTVLMPNLPWPVPGSVSSDPAVLRATLTGAELQRYQDHAGAEPARHVVLRKGGRWCYVMFRVERLRGLPFASILHVSDPDLFARMARPFARHLLLRHRTIATLAEPRVTGRRPWPSVAISRKPPKMFRSSRLRAADADDLYSELAFQPW